MDGELLPGLLEGVSALNDTSWCGELQTPISREMSASLRKRSETNVTILKMFPPSSIRASSPVMAYYEFCLFGVFQHRFLPLPLLAPCRSGTGECRYAVGRLSVTLFRGLLLSRGFLPRDPGGLLCALVGRLKRRRNLLGGVCGLLGWIGVPVEQSLFAVFLRGLKVGGALRRRHVRDRRDLRLCFVRGRTSICGGLLFIFKHVGRALDCLLLLVVAFTRILRLVSIIIVVIICRRRRTR